ncbi:unnamed protein product [Litomosoides sigmodontis]|uniref:J domain-containing protein n=1 Tax=Litomosoides sigmodontis TaxID=42156 RepID=A0A3P6THW9_LITSI|nr:unnamed protein product [Litomosoides sigmodontis]
MCAPRLDSVVRSSVRQPLYYSSYLLLCTHQNLSGKNYYDILEVKRGASIAEIKSAFYKLSKKYHPDALEKSKDPAIYLEIKNAYEVLKDKKKRRDYDLELADALNPRRTYREYHETADQSYKKYSSSNFYARTPQYDNDNWYEWYRNRRVDQMEKHWIPKGAESYCTKIVLVFFLTSFIFSMIIRLRTEHLRRKEWIEHMVRRSEVRENEIRNLR